VSYKLLVLEGITERGLQLLKAEGWQIDQQKALPPAELARIVGAYDAMTIRSGSQITAEVLEAGKNLKVVGRPGVGVDNVDLEAATRLGIMVMNSPMGNLVSTAELALALLFAVARNVAQADAAMKAERWERKAFPGVELSGKRLGVVGFGRIGREVAARARALGMDIAAFDPFVAPAVAEAQHVPMLTLNELMETSDFITLHTTLTRESRHLIGKQALARAKRGLRIVNAARGELIDLDALVEGLESGKVAGAALDVFPEEPFTDHPIFQRDDVVVTPHLGASTTEAQDRAGLVTAEQVTAALTGGVVTNAVNIAAVRPEEMEALAPFVPLCEKLGRLAQGLGNGSIDRVVAEFRGRIADHDTRLLGIAVLVGILSGHTEEPVNLVNAPQMADERGIELIEQRDSLSGDFTELVRVRIESGDDQVEVAGTGVGPRNEPYLVSVWGEGFYLPFAEHLAIFRYTDQPGMIGRVGTAFGEEGVNIISAAVGAEQSGDRAVMALTTDAPVQQSTIDKIIGLDGFSVGRAVDV
jgi:D-3-phosphoglycerate dehydrogenase